MFARFRPFVRVFAAVLCTTFAVALVAASPAPQPAYGSKPVLVIFPFRVADGLDPANGANYARLMGISIQNAGNIDVIVGNPATQPADYLHVTALAGGDYYLSGYITPPVGNTTSVLEQVVSRRSGTTVWGTTAHITSDSDISDQGPILRDALLAYVDRGFYAILNPTPTPVPTPKVAPKKKNGIETSASGGGGSGSPAPKILDLPPEAYGFSSAPTAPPKVYASAAHPARFAIMNITGSYIPDAQKRYTEASLVSTLSHHGEPALPGDPDKTKHFLMHPQEVCTQTGASFLVFGVLSTSSNDATTGAQPWTNASYTPIVYDCAAQAYNRTGKPVRGAAFDWKTAIDRATLKATTDFFAKLPGASAATHA